MAGLSNNSENNALPTQHIEGGIGLKSYNHLFETICSFENLYFASKRAEKGKRYRADVALFNANREQNLLVIQKLLLHHAYPFGKFRTRKIYQPKPRIISAAPYADRVVHQALVGVIAPLFEKKFIFDSYANRKGKGTTAALDRCTQFARRYKYVLQLDIRKYFPSIDHGILFNEIRKTIRCRDTLRLIDQIICSSNEQEAADFYFPGDDLFTPLARRKGLPIGNLTSQFFANVYLNAFDHFVKETLRAPGYIRYVDDFLTFSNSKEQLWAFLPQYQSFLAEYRLLFHGKKQLIFPSTCGIPFLGFRVYPEHRRLLPYNVKRARARMRALVKAYRQRRLAPAEIRMRLMAWIGHVQQGDTWGLRKAMFRQYPFIRK